MWPSGAAVPSSAAPPSPQQQQQPSNSAKSSYPPSFAYPPTPPVEMKMEANSHTGGNCGDYLNSGGGGGLPGMNDLHRHHSPDAMAFSAAAYSAAASMPSSSSPSSSLAGKKFHEGTQMSAEQSLDPQQQQQSHNPEQPSPTSVAAAAVSATTAYPYFAAAPTADLSSPLYGSYANSGVMKGPFAASSPSSSAAGIKQSSRSKTSRSNAGKRSSRCKADDCFG